MIRCPGQTVSIFDDPGAVISYAWRGCPSPVIGTPPAPSGSDLTTAPADEAAAQALVDSLLNQEVTNQQATNAAAVTSDWTDVIAGNAAAAAPNSATLYYILAAAALVSGAVLWRRI